MLLLIALKAAYHTHKHNSSNYQHQLSKKYYFKPRGVYDVTQ